MVFPSRDLSIQAVPSKMLCTAHRHFLQALSPQTFLQATQHDTTSPSQYRHCNNLCRTIFTVILKWKGTQSNYQEHSNSAWGPREVRTQWYLHERWDGVDLHLLLWSGMAPPDPCPRLVVMTPGLLPHVTNDHYPDDCLANSG